MSRREWQPVRLGGYCSKIGSGSTPRGGEKVYQAEGTAFIRSQNVYNGVFAPNGLAFLGDEEAERLDGVTVQKGDVLLNITGDSVARCCQVPETVLPARVNQHVAIVRPKPDEFDARFLMYFLISQWMQSVMLSLAGSGGTRKALTKAMIEGFEIPKPLLQVQSDIAEVLVNYDDLIENNRRRMALLEEAARQLYQEWFVRLRFPGHEHTHIAKGAPDSWEKKPVSELTTFLNRGIAPHYDDDAEGLVINQKCIRNGRLDTALARRQSREFKPDRQIQVGDVLVNSTGEGTLGRIAQVNAPLPNCTVDTHITLVRPKTETGLHYFGMAVMAWEPRFSTMGRGATNQTELSRDTIGKAEILIPTHSLVQQFEEFAAPLFQQVVHLMAQSEKLRAARDLLLPRLMSGEIAV